MDNKMIICADAIALHGKRIILVERVRDGNGLALPGGKHEHGEHLSATAVREFGEETGMELQVESILDTYDKTGRDPRGRFVSTVFIGKASGVTKDEPGKTHVVMLTEEEIIMRKEEFLFDHFQILSDYFKLETIY